MNNMSNNRNYNPNNNIRNNQRRSNNGYQRQESNYGADYAQKFTNRDRIQRNDKNKVSGKYGNICNTMQKKFNMTLYQGQNNNNKKINNNKSGSKYRIENNCRANQNKGRNQKVNINRSNNERANNRFNIIDSKSSLDKNKRDRVQFNRNFNNKEVDNKDRKTSLKDYSEIDNISTQIEEETNALPKSVFVYITVAVAFVAILIFIVAKGGTQGNKINRVDNSKTQKQVQEDNGLNFDDIEDESSEGGIELGEGEEEVNPTDNQLNNPNVDNNVQNITSTGNTSTNSSTTSAKPTSNTNNITNQTNSTVSSTTTTNKKPTTTTNKKPTTNQTNKPTTNNSNTEEVEEEEEVVEENVPMSYIPMQVTGMLYHCSGFYGSYGATGEFQRYTKFQELGNGIRVPTKDLKGIWIDVRGMKIIDYVGYKAGEKTNVVRIELENSDSTSCGTIYAIKGTFVSLGGTYRKKNSTSTFTTMFAESDVELIKIGS